MVARSSGVPPLAADACQSFHLYAWGESDKRIKPNAADKRKREAARSIRLISPECSRAIRKLRPRCNVSED